MELLQAILKRGVYIEFENEVRLTIVAPWPSINLLLHLEPIDLTHDFFREVPEAAFNMEDL